MVPDGHPYEILDVFTDTPLQGNPLAVFTAAEHIPSRLMQATARELNLSETAFLLPGERDCDAQARIFTPLAELPFAGHPVLGAAFVVADRDGLDTVRLRTGAGIVPVRLTRDGERITSGEMDQPIPTVEPYPRGAQALAALGIDGTALPVETYTNGPAHVMIGLGHEEQVAALEPDMTALAALGPYCFSCFAGAGSRYKTRMFGIGLGVVEDPATGSAAGPLAVHLARHGCIRFGETIEITQGVEIGRPSRLLATVEGDPRRIERVTVAGSAVRVAHGHYRLQ